VPRPTRTSLRTVALFCAGILAFVGCIAAWNAAPNNPREGWSLAEIRTGAIGRSPSGDRAFHTFTIPRGNYTYAHAGNNHTAIVMVVGRRTRYGLFVPWHETTNLRAHDMAGTVRDWQTGTTNPTWTPLVQAMLTTHQQRLAGMTQPDHIAYEQRIVDAMQAELAGLYPERRIMWGGLALDALAVLSHLLLLVMVLIGVRAGIRSAISEHRAMQGRCTRCGYNIRGIDGPCPECGDSLSAETS
jgi:hypothetical protein